MYGTKCDVHVRCMILNVMCIIENVEKVHVFPQK